MNRELPVHAWSNRQRRRISRIVRDTEAPTDALPVIRVEDRTPSDYYDERLGEVLDLAGTVGALLMASGTATIDTAGQIRRIVNAYGFPDCSVDVINTAIHISVYRGPKLPPGSSMHIVPTRSTDFSRLATIDRLVNRICTPASGWEVREEPADDGQDRTRTTGEQPIPPSSGPPISPAEARAELDTIMSAPHPYRRWIATLAWGALAFATAGTLGGGPLACVVAALSTMVIDRTNRRLNKLGLPFFFQYAVGGVIATAPALAFFWLMPDREIRLGSWTLQFQPQVTIAAGLVVILAGLSLVSSIGDLISGAPVTAAGRFFELVMLTVATIAGVALSLHVSARLGGPEFTIGSQAPPALSEILIRVAFGAATAAAFALACYAERSALTAAAIGGGAGVGAFLAAQGLGIGAVFSSFAAAVPIGLVGHLMERRQLAPPLVVSIAGIIPLMPGLALLHGVYGIIEDADGIGFNSVLTATAIATALASGVTLGEWLSKRLHRTGRMRPVRRSATAPGD
ncbi:threonine/serine ThrE exporter family protein [Mycolicibacterium brumae]|uniref:threonine/serine ThrE exporter family protein n=1 Tax=Mycolicibacterium brumae TaxID=85968 RepID=UPI000A52B3B5|nr:threonine/serine exporter family protein [Mycolicibacterium brumae]RWA18454.1 hypothetical protein MBRU_04355 [Mycolicibacterium brumae DSM 44177]UWW10322.1 threonine/serine exporter family protein [Mycolicibacterium brumae]